MPVLDNCHHDVVSALEKDGWSIKSENEFYRHGNRSIFIDIRAEKIETGQVERVLLAEIKCFSDEQSRNSDWYVAIGQYLIYREIIDILQVNIPVYLAIPHTIYDMIADDVIDQLIEKHHIKLLLVNMDSQQVVKWIN